VSSAVHDDIAINVSHNLIVHTLGSQRTYSDGNITLPQDNLRGSLNTFAPFIFNITAPSKEVIGKLDKPGTRSFTPLSFVVETNTRSNTPAFTLLTTASIFAGSTQTFTNEQLTLIWGHLKENIGVHVDFIIRPQGSTVGHPRRGYFHMFPYSSSNQFLVIGVIFQK
jgi:hypothetical protein